MKNSIQDLNSLEKKELVDLLIKTKKELAFYKEEVENDRELIEKFDKVKSEFIAVTSHQLRTPISSIRWCLEILLSEDFGEINQKQRNFMRQAYDSNDRILHILEDLLRAAEIEKGKAKLEKEEVSFEALVKKIINHF